MAALNPGIGGSALLLLASLSYLPNSVIWAIAYMLGPGFAFGVGTAVSPSGSALGAVPAFPMLAALPVGRPGRVPALARLLRPRHAVPGRRAGRADDRADRADADPRGGAAVGAAHRLADRGASSGSRAKLSGGPLGAGRLASVGPAGGEVGLVAVLEVGVTAALVAGAANWLIIRHHIRRLPAAAYGGRAAQRPAATTRGRPDRRRRRPPHLRRPLGQRHRPSNRRTAGGTR